MRALALASLLSLTVLAGCLGGDDGDASDDDLLPTYGGRGTVTDVHDRELLPFEVMDSHSHTLVEGVFDILDGLDVYVDIPLPATEGGNAINPLDPPRAHLGLFLPDIPGCDFSTITDMAPGMVPGIITGGGHDGVTNADHCKVPVIADAGPYYRTPGDQIGSEGDVPAAERGSGRLGEFLITRFVPHGYAVAQISVMGSGLSNHCFDMFGLAEQLGVHHAVDWLGSQAWSNGNVGLTGRSYDGSTPWMAAKHASPALKTIVPISGLSGLGDLVQWNGAAEGRILTFQNVIYGTFGLDSHQLATDVAAHATCPDWVTSIPWGAASYASGDDVVDMQGAYWAERHFIPGALANYDGSLFMVHGLQDGNVDPHAGWIGELALREKGNDVLAMWGQWYHSYPDRLTEHGYNANSHQPIGPPNSIRMDWAQMLLEWFDHYLMESGPKPALGTEIQQLEGPWRYEPVWPPEDAIIREMPLGSGTITVGGGNSFTDINLGPLSADGTTVVGGFSRAVISASPQGPAGVVSIELRDGTDNIDLGISWGVMDVRYAGEGSGPAVPGQTVQMDIPLQLFDVGFPAGHDLVARISSGAGGYGALVPMPVDVDLSQSTLYLSTLDRDESFYFEPPVWWLDDGDCFRQKGIDVSDCA